MEIDFVKGIGIVATVIGVFMVVVGGILRFQEETEWTWNEGPVETRPYEDIGRWLFINGYWVVVLGIATIIIGFFLSWLKRSKKQGV